MTESANTKQVQQTHDAWRVAALAVRELAVSDPIAALDALSTMGSELELRTAMAVGAARQAGHTWDEIGKRLRVTRQAAQKRYGSIDPTRWDGTSERCQAAGRITGDTDLCEGSMDAAWVMESREIPSDEEKRERGTLACVHHGAKLYAQIGQYARVYPTGGPDDPRRAALEIYHRAQDIRAKASKGRAA